MRVRFSAWLNAAPETEKDKEPRLSRLEKLRRDRKDKTFQPRMPPVDGGEQILQWFWELMGDAVISHTELRHWQENTGFELQSWQARLLHRMSMEYLGEAAKATDPKCEPPWKCPDLALSKAQVAEQLRLAMRATLKLGEN